MKRYIRSAKLSEDELYEASIQFEEILQSLVEERYPGCSFFEETYGDEYDGTDEVSVSTDTGDYRFSFDIKKQENSIRRNGAEKAAQLYFKQICKGIDTGSALAQ